MPAFDRTSRASDRPSRPTDARSRLSPVPRSSRVASRRRSPLGPRARSAALALALAPALVSTAVAAAPTAGIEGAAVRGGETLGWLSIDVGRVVRECESLDLVRLFHDEEVQDFLAPAIAAIEASAEWRQFEAGRFLAEAYGFPRVIAGRVSLAVFGVGEVTGLSEDWYGPERPLDHEPGRGQTLPDVLLCVETSGREAFASSVGRLLELDPTWVTEDVVHEGPPMQVTRFPVSGSLEVRLYHGFAGDRFLAAFRPERLDAAIAELEARGADAAPAEGSLAATPGFRRFREVSSRGTSIVELFVNADGLRDFLAPGFLSDRERGELAALGLDRVHAAGLALGLESGRLRDSFSVVFDPQRPGILQVLGAARPDAAIYADVPGDTAGALAWRCDLGALLDAFADIAAEIHPGEYRMIMDVIGETGTALGFDIRSELLESVGDGFALSATLPRGGLVPDLLGRLTVDDPETFGRCLSVLLGLAEQESHGALELVDAEVDGATLARYAKIQDVPLSPALALTADGLRLAGSFAALRTELRRPSTPVDPADGDHEFGASLAATVGGGADDVAALLYVDVPRVAEYGLGMAGMVLPAVLNELPVRLDPAMFPMPETVADHLSGLLLTARVGDNYLAFDSSSSFGGLLVPTVFGAIGVAVEQRERAASMAAMRAEEAARRAAAAQSEASADAAFLGVNYDPGAGGTAGLEVISVVAGSPAESAGILAGDRVIELSGNPVGSAADFTAAMRGRAPGESVAVKLRRGDVTVGITVKLGRRGDHVDR